MGAAYVNEAVDFLTSYPGIAYATFIVMIIKSIHTAPNRINTIMSHNCLGFHFS